MRLPVAALLSLTCLVLCVEARNFIITASSYIRPGIPYLLNVAIYNATGTVDVQAKLSYWTRYDRTREKIIATDQTQSFRRPVTEPSVGGMELNTDKLRDKESWGVTLDVVVLGGGLNKTYTTSLVSQAKVLSLFVQTDKAMYKPSQKVQFRIIAVDSNLRPYTGPMNISVTDSKTNKIKLWQNHEDKISMIYGVRNFSLQLTDQPVQGDWKIMVQAKDQKTEKTFTVAEYVLPKFEVTFDMPDHYLFMGQGIKGSVVARYTYGQPVKGNATLAISLDYRPSKYTGVRTVDCEKRHLTLKDGRADFEITEEDIMSYKLPPNACFQGVYRNADKLEVQKCHRDSFLGDVGYIGNVKVKVDGNVTETLTDITLSGEGEIEIKYNSIKMEFLPMTPSNFKPGLLYMAFVKLSKVNGDPLDEKTFPKLPPLNVTVTLIESGRGYQSTVKHLGFVDVQRETGIAAIEWDVPDNITSFNLRADVMDPGTASKTHKKVTAGKYGISKFESKAQVSLQVRLHEDTGEIKPETDVTFIVKASQIPTDLTYQLLSKGRLIKQGVIPAGSLPFGLSSDSSISTAQFKVYFDSKLAQEASPSARMLVWFMTVSNEMIVDTVDFSVKGAIANQVDIKASTNDTSPGEEVTLKMTAAPSSYVGLLAVDQSVLLLRSGNDITEDQVMDELAMYDPSRRYLPIPYYGRGGSRFSYCCYPIFISGTDATQVLERAGVKVFTDAYIHRKEYLYARARGPDVRFQSSPVAEAGAPGQAGPAGPAGPASPQGQRGEAGRPGEPGQPNKSVQPVTKIRQEFPETWIWTDTILGPEGYGSLATSVPDTITSWVVSAFAVSDTKGLGVAIDKPKIQVSKPFFVSLTLPYSVIYGEEFGLKMTVFNYMDKDQDVILTLENENEHFEIIKGKGSKGTNKNARKRLQMNIKVPKGDGHTETVWIRPLKLGNIPIKVKAQSGQAADALVRRILVEAPGAPEEYTQTFILNRTNSDKLFVVQSDIQVPRDEVFFVPDSEHITISAIGDLMGTTLQNLGRLVRMPYGCGEQNMINFVPNIYIRKYLESVDRADPAITEKTNTYMEQGYQKELIYKHTSRGNVGSYSAFGDRDESGSTWLTAFVMKSFGQARPYITIDEDVIKSAATFVVNQQNDNGTFREPGRVLHKDLKGGSSSSAATLAAYILIGLQENKDILKEPKYITAMDKAQRLLEEQTTNIRNDTYTLAIVYYALELRNSPMAGDLLRELMGRAVSEGVSLHWEGPKPKPWNSRRGWRPPYHQARSSDIEMTAYVLLGISKIGAVGDGLRIMKWLTSQQNAYGGYASTQDTAIGLQALSEIAELAYGNLNCGKDDGLNIQVESTSNTKTENFEFEKIIKENSLILQTLQLPNPTTEIRVSATGCGFALMKLAVQYHVMDTDVPVGVALNASSLVNTKNQVELSTCAKSTTDEQNGMAVVEVSKLSGYEIDVAGLLSKYKPLGLKKVENLGSKVAFYFDEFEQQGTCINIVLDQVDQVSNLQEAKVQAYSYYSPEKSDTLFYLPSQLRKVDRCVLCPDCCKDDDRRQTGPDQPKGPKLGPTTGASAVDLTMPILLVSLVISLYGNMK